MNEATAVIADDEPLLRADLREQLAQCWPELRIVAEAANGHEAVLAVAAHQPDVLFLDVQMPRMNGLDAAARLKGQVEIVFLTAYDQYAIAAFEQRAADYLLKPPTPERLAETVLRLREKLQAAQEPLAWIKASVGSTVRLIKVDEVFAFKAVPGYTEVLTAQTQALIRTPLRDLLPQLDPRRFVQLHRNAIVNLDAIECAQRLADGRYAVQLKGGRGTVETSRSRAAFFRESGEGA